MVSMITCPILNCFLERMAWMNRVVQRRISVQRDEGYNENVRKIARIQASLEKLTSRIYVGSSWGAPYKETDMEISSLGVSCYLKSYHESCCFVFCMYVVLCLVVTCCTFDLSHLFTCILWSWGLTSHGWYWDY